MASVMSKDRIFSHKDLSDCLKNVLKFCLDKTWSRFFMLNPSGVNAWGIIYVHIHLVTEAGQSLLILITCI